MEPIGCLLLLLFLPMFSTISLYQKLRANLCWRFSKDLWIRNCQNKVVTRWTFFRVKLVFECEFEIFGPWDPWTLEPLDLGTLGPLPSSNTSSYFPLHPLTSSYLFLLLSSFGMFWLGGQRSQVHLQSHSPMSQLPPPLTKPYQRRRVRGRDRRR